MQWVGKLCKHAKISMINSVGQVVSLVFFPYGLAASGSEQVGNGSQPQVRALQGQKENNILEGSFQERKKLHNWESLGEQFMEVSDLNGYPYSVIKYKDQGQWKAGQQQSERKTCFSHFRNQETRNNALKGIDRSIQNWYTQESKVFRLWPLDSVVLHYAFADLHSLNILISFPCSVTSSFPCFPCHSFLPLYPFACSLRLPLITVNYLFSFDILVSVIPGWRAMSHRKFERPRHGSLGFLPRKRTKCLGNVSCFFMCLHVS